MDFGDGKLLKCVTFVRGFVKLKKFKKSENSEVGGWVKPQHGFFYFFGNFVFFMFLFCCTCFQKKLKNWIGGGWVVSDQSDFFSDFLIFLTLQDP